MKLIWTHHARQRLKERGISQSMIEETIRHPITKRPAKRPKSQEFRRKFAGRTLSVVAQLKTHDEWRVLSCWLNPPLQGTVDWKEYKRYHQYRREYAQAGFWRKFWLVLKRQLGF